MSVRKRNAFLDGDESEDDLENGYDSDANEESRGIIAGRTYKRRRIEDLSDAESIDEEHDDRVNASEELTSRNVEQPVDEHGNPPESGDPAERDIFRSGVLPEADRTLPKHVAAAQKKAHRTGVVYISRVPPFMKPQTLKHFLAPHAPKGIGRVFLTPEDHTAHTRRVHSGGNKKKSYTDGRAEFVSKRDAKIAVETLNGNIIGGKKGNFYHDDLWSMKYLKGFKWSHLTEQISNENAERAARMREEVRRTRKENKAFVEDVERGKMLEGMEAKRKAKSGARADVKPVNVRKRENEFKQKPPQTSRTEEKISDQASRMQRMIF